MLRTMTATQTTPAAKQADPYLKAFERFEQAGASRQPSWLFPLRKAGIARFAELGFPTLKHEDWRFTNVAPIAKLPFKPVFEATVATAHDGVTRSNSPSRNCPARASSSSTAFTPPNFPPSHAARTDQGRQSRRRAGERFGVIEKHLGRYARTEDNAFAALNTAFFQDGGFVYVPAGQSVAEPVQFLFINTSKDAGATTHPRNLIIVERDGQG